MNDANTESFFNAMIEKGNVKLRKTFVIESKAVDPEAGIYEAMVSTESVDRDGDILLAEGADLTNYYKNPVILFGHNYYDPGAVVAKAIEVSLIPGKGVKKVFQFIERGINAKADLVRDLWDKGFLNAMSVGFIPVEWEKRTDETGEPLQRGRVYKKWEMLESSIVTIPANQDALRLALKTLDELLKETQTNDDGEQDDPVSELPEDNDVEPNTNEPIPDASETELPPEVIDSLSNVIQDLTEEFNNDG